MDKMRRVRDLEKRLKEQKDEEEDEEQKMLEEKKKKRAKRAGLKPLGPVMAREEAVDPLQKLAAPAEPEDLEPAPEADLPTSQSGQWQSLPREKKEDEKKRRSQEQGKPQAQPQQQQLQPEHNKHKKKKKRRREDDEERSEESEKHPHQHHSHPSQHQHQNPPPQRKRRSRSRSEEERAAASSGLMTEAQVLAMMGKEKAKEKPQRGSVQARMRIQREMQEWNSTKAENEEFWKAPKFALCYSAETSRTLRGNTGPSLADANRKAADKNK